MPNTATTSPLGWTSSNDTICEGLDWRIHEVLELVDHLGLTHEVLFCPRLVGLVSSVCANDGSPEGADNITAITATDHEEVVVEGGVEVELINVNTLAVNRTFDGVVGMACCVDLVAPVNNVTEEI